MAAYVIVEIQVEDPETYEEYKKLAAGTVSLCGGRYLVRGGVVECLEGDWTPGRLVVLEFPDVARARAWWSSPEYSVARDVRWRSAHTRMVVVAGV